MASTSGENVSLLFRNCATRLSDRRVLRRRWSVQARDEIADAGACLIILYLQKEKTSTPERLRSPSAHELEGTKRIGSPSGGSPGNIPKRLAGNSERH